MNPHMHAARSLLLPALLVSAIAARADTGSDWLAKVPPPPKTLAQAQSLCGENAPHPRVWDTFEAQRKAAEDKLQKDMQKRMSDPATQQAMMEQAMSQSMDPASAMAAQQYAQYVAGLGQASPDAKADGLFKPPYTDADGKVDAVLKAANARIKKCPLVPGGEMGPYPAPACQKPIDADSAAKKAALADQYLGAVNKSWPQFVAGAQDYFKKLNVVPQGVDAGNFQVKQQRDSLPLQELAAVQTVARQAEQACENAVVLDNKFLNTGDD